MIPDFFWNNGLYLDGYQIIRLAWEDLLSFLLSIRDTQRVLSEELSEQKRKEDPGEIYFG